MTVAEAIEALEKAKLALINRDNDCPLCFARHDRREDHKPSCPIHIALSTLQRLKPVEAYVVRDDLGTSLGVDFTDGTEADNYLPLYALTEEQEDRP